MAHCLDKNDQATFDSPIVYILADGQNLYYDGEVLQAQEGMTAMQIGTYRYTTRLGEKVVPLIQFQSTLN